MKALHMIAFVLLVVGGINWGLIGLSGFLNMDLEIVNRVLGAWPQVEWLVYVLVGVSAVWLGLGHKSACRDCASM